MKHISYLILILILTVSCRTENQTNHEWIRAYTQNISKMAKQVVEETGNRNSDLEIIDNIQKYQDITSELISELDNGNKQAVIKKVQEHIDTLRTSSNRIKIYFSISKSTSVENIKTQLALLEQETLNSYTNQIGSTDMMFDQLDIFFVPDEYIINKNEPVKGTIYMGATTSRSEKMKMFINGSEIPIKSGGGRVELPYSDITPNFEFKANFRNSLQQRTGKNDQTQEL